MQVTSGTFPAPRAPRGPALRMVAVGDSLTAGTQDATTLQARQEHCYAKVIADQAGLRFGMPYLSGEGIPFQIWRNGAIDARGFSRRLFMLEAAMAPVALFSYYLGAPPLIAPTWDLIGMGRREAATRNTAAHPQSNFAVPGYNLRNLYNIHNTRDYARELHQGLDSIRDVAVLPLIETTLGNGWNGGTGSAIEQANQQNPDVVLCWAGNNDALAAVFGGVVDDRVLTPVDDRKWRFQETSPLTGKTYWRETHDVVPGFRRQVLGPGGLMDRLLHGSHAQIALLNLPDVTVIPLLREVGKPVGKLPFRVVLSNGQDVTRLIENWVIPDGVVGQGHGGRTHFPPGTRVALTKVLFRLVQDGPPASPVHLMIKMAAAHPAVFTEDDVLDPDELKTISHRIDAFNQILADAAKRSPRVHLVNVHDVLQDSLRLGRKLRGPGPDEWIVPGYTGAPDTRGRDGMFSYDGVHPSDTGQAVIANLVLDRLRADLAGDPRFQRLTTAPPVDEKAVHHQDPHSARRGAAPAIVLDGAHLKEWTGLLRF